MRKVLNIFNTVVDGEFATIAEVLPEYIKIGDRLEIFSKDFRMYEDSVFYKLSKVASNLNLGFYEELPEHCKKIKDASDAKSKLIIKDWLPAISINPKPLTDIVSVDVSNWLMINGEAYCRYTPKLADSLTDGWSRRGDILEFYNENIIYVLQEGYVRHKPCKQYEHLQIRLDSSKECSLIIAKVVDNSSYITKTCVFNSDVYEWQRISEVEEFQVYGVKENL